MSMHNARAKLKRFRSERGDIALVFLLMFMVLAVPLASATVQFSGQLIRNSQVYNDRLSGGDSARAGIELALWHLRNDEEPPEELSLAINDGTTNVTLDEGTTTADLSEFAYADFVLTLDVSASISSSMMQDLKEAAHALIDAFQLESTNGRIRIGITKFRGDTASVTTMTDDPLDLHGGIDGVNATSIFTCFFNPGSPACTTNILLAINGGAAQFSTGLGDRPEVPNLLVVITDGNDTAGNDIDDIEDASEGASQDGVAEIFAVGVGGGVDQDTLDAIATEEDNAFHVNDFGGEPVEECDPDSPFLMNLITCIVQAVNDSALFGTLYDIQSVAPDGSCILVHALLTPEKETIILSWEETVCSVGED